MKILIKTSAVLAISFSLTSCFLFKGGGGNSKPCPAYGQEKTSHSIDNFAQNSSNNNIIIETK